MSPILLDMDIGGMTVEVEPPHQYYITFCCNRGAVWHNGMGVCMKQRCATEFPYVKKFYPLTFNDICWTFMEK